MPHLEKPLLLSDFLGIDDDGNQIDLGQGYIDIKRNPHPLYLRYTLDRSEADASFQIFSSIFAEIHDTQEDYAYNYDDYSILSRKPKNPMGAPFWYNHGQYYDSNASTNIFDHKPTGQLNKIFGVSCKAKIDFYMDMVASDGTFLHSIPFETTLTKAVIDGSAVPPLVSESSYALDAVEDPRSGSRWYGGSNMTGINSWPKSKLYANNWKSVVVAKIEILSNTNPHDVKLVWSADEGPNKDELSELMSQTIPMVDAFYFIIPAIDKGIKFLGHVEEEPTVSNENMFKITGELQNEYFDRESARQIYDGQQLTVGLQSGAPIFYVSPDRYPIMSLDENGNEKERNDRYNQNLNRDKLAEFRLRFPRKDIPVGQTWRIRFFKLNISKPIIYADEPEFPISLFIFMITLFCVVILISIKSMVS